MDRCCDLRVKIMLTCYNVPEEDCGVPDSAVADVLVWDEKSPLQRPIVQFRFCGWCGKPWKPNGTIWEAPKPEADEEWKRE